MIRILNMPSDRDAVKNRKTLAVLCVTVSGYEKAKELASIKEVVILYTHALSERLIGESNNLKHIPQAEDMIFESFAQMSEYAFKHFDKQLWIMALGIVVRSIAPHISDKYHDPAVLVMDEQAQHIISVLSGHIGGANALTLEIANLLNARPVITTATDVYGLGAFELYLKSLGLDPKPYRSVAKWVNRRLVEGHKTALYLDDFGSYHQPMPIGLTPIYIREGHETSLCSSLEVQTSGVYLGIRACDFSVTVSIEPVYIRRLVIGIGFRRGKTAKELEAAVVSALKEYGYAFESVHSFATIEKKARESGLIELANHWDIPIHVVSLASVEALEGSCSTSEFVRDAVGVGAVAEPCALALSEKKLLKKKKAYGGITLAFGYLSVNNGG
jgi:cobalt-precorrin 5A hydrolase